MAPNSNSIGSIDNNQGIITQGQTGNNTVIQGRIPRHLGEEDKAAVLARLLRSRPISIIVVMNDGEAIDFANEIATFLRPSGYSVGVPDQAMMWGPNGTPRGTNINTNDDKPSEPVQITVGVQ